MPVIATFKAIQFGAFSNPPAGGNDPFVLANDNADDFLNVSIDDDDTVIDGDTITNEVPDDGNQIATVTDSDGNLVSTDACYIEWTATYTGANGQVIEVWRFELDNGLRLFAVSEIPEAGVVFTTNNKDQGADNLDPADVPDTPCLTRGTLIKTADGLRAIETLQKGDSIALFDEGYATLRWIGARTFGPSELKSKPKLLPIRIVQGALGEGLPQRDMLVSRQHRMLVRSMIAMRMFGSPEVLIAANKLTHLPGIFVDHGIGSVTYYHLLFDDHEIILAEGAPTESLFTGPEALSALGPDAREEISEIFPALRALDYAPVPARLIPATKKQKELALRHHKNQKQLFNLTS
ncbi:Hint domain-containing protein [Yoonia sp. GPGPB17]|uniref:Hint domain-containing protein n=1 Tax=Yoonia sp. GPGPB17 TaxID=3026147 RepID=UPI0030C216C1